MSPRYGLAAFGAAVVVAALAARSGSSAKPGGGDEGDGGPPVAAPAARPAGRRLGLAVDTTYTYALSYASENTTTSLGLPGLGTSAEGAHGLVHLVGKLALHAYPGDAPDEQLVGWSVPEVATALLRVIDQDLWKGKADADATFADAEMLALGDASGRPRLLASRAHDGGLFDHVMQLLVQDLSVELGPGDRWSVLEASPHGVARSVYTLGGTNDGGAAPPRALVRERDAFTLLRAAGGLDREPSVALTSRHEGMLAPEGFVESWAGEESLTVRDRAGARVPMVQATTKVSLRLVAIAREPRPRPSFEGLAARPVSEPAAAKTDRAAVLTARVSGLTEEEALAMLDGLGVLDRLPDQDRFLWRVAALTELRPAFCDRLAALFERAPRGGSVQAVVLDVLANSGTERAQSTMRTLLGKREAQDHASYALLVQRFSTVTRPSVETGRWVATRYREASRDRKRDVRLASAFTLGSIADRLRDTDEGASRAYADELRDGLRRAEDDATLAYLVTAVANTDDPGLAGWLGGYAAHPSAEVRASVAAALDEPPTTEARRILLELAGDPDKGVQGQAIRSLRNHTLSAANLELLASYAAAGRFHATNLRALLDMVKPYRASQTEAARDVLRALLSVGVADPEVRAAVVLLLG